MVTSFLFAVHSCNHKRSSVLQTSPWQEMGFQGSSIKQKAVRKAWVRGPRLRARDVQLTKCPVSSPVVEPYHSLAANDPRNGMEAGLVLSDLATLTWERGERREGGGGKGGVTQTLEMMVVSWPSQSPTTCTRVGRRGVSCVYGGNNFGTTAIHVASNPGLPHTDFISQPWRENSAQSNTCNSLLPRSPPPPSPPVLWNMLSPPQPRTHH